MAFGIFKKIAKIAFAPVTLAYKAVDSLLGGGKKEAEAPEVAAPMQQEIGPDPGAVADISAPPGAVGLDGTNLNPEASAERMEKALAEQRRRSVGGLMANIQGGASNLFAARQERLKSKLG